jgi:E3 ubiquitin-protein ligase TRIP12
VCPEASIANRPVGENDDAAAPVDRPDAGNGGDSGSSAAAGRVDAPTTSSSGETPSGSAATGPPQQQQHHQQLMTEQYEVSRLQTLLDYRGLPGHFLSSLGPRMQSLLSRTTQQSQGLAGPPPSGRIHSLIQGMLMASDESHQLQSLMEVCQLLLMGNEETLGSGFPIKACVQSLIPLLGMEHNFDMMTNACRALTYIMEALPHSASVVVDAIPSFLQKLQKIECIDVAEQSLTAIEMLSRRHSKSILTAGGIEACLTYLDFFSISAQRSALTIASNCCYHMNADEFGFIADSLPSLSQRLSVQDRKSVESVCLCFTRMVDNFQNDSDKLESIASDSTLKNLLPLLVMSPAILSTGAFVSVVRMLHLMCVGCPSLAVKLLKMNIAETLRYLLLGTAEQDVVDIELVGRTPQESYEIVCLIGELLPRLPTDGLFTIDALLRRSPVSANNDVLWQWKDDHGTWRHYTGIDCRILEAAFQSREDEVSINAHGRTYTVDFHSMTQINEDSGNSRAVYRKVNYSSSRAPPSKCTVTCLESSFIV